MSAPYFVYDDSIPSHQLIRSTTLESLFIALEQSFDLVPSAANLISGRANYALTEGTSSAFTVALPVPLVTIDVGTEIRAKMHTASVGTAPTLKVDGTSSYIIRDFTGAALIDGALPSGAIVTFNFDGSVWRTNGVTSIVTVANGSITTNHFGMTAAQLRIFAELASTDAATFGALVASTSATLRRDVNNSFLRISGGNANNVGANIELYGGADATFPNQAYYDANRHVFRTQDAGTETVRIHTTGGDVGLFVGNDNHIDPAVAEYGVTMTPEGALHIKRLAGHPMNIGRSNSGSLVSFYIGTTQQGVISESGGTVTYGAFCGAHWSQFSDMSTPDILPGTIFETIDEMCAWPGETNLTLPKIQIASEGSRRVYGVFSHWDNEQDQLGNPINISDLHSAGLGAKFVRIAPGETVEGGDLIECDGNGCGRVQADDLFRSSTVAKVTAGIAVETYPDGSFLVPCTLHCG